jgi:general stress protein 26
LKGYIQHAAAVDDQWVGAAARQLTSGKGSVTLSNDVAGCEPVEFLIETGRCEKVASRRMSVSEDLQNYEQVSVYKLNPDDQEQLLLSQRECVFNWCTKDEWPMGVIMSYIWRNGSVWLTAGAHRHRISAIRRNPQVSVVITSTGTDMGPGKTVTIKGTCKIHEDSATKEWFYPDFAGTLRPDAEAARAFEQMLNSPMRVVLEVVPEKWITYDGLKMRAHTAGTLDESELAEPLESDTVRFQQEAKRRGL